MAASLLTLMTVIDHGLLIFATGIIVVLKLSVNLTSMHIFTVTLDSSADIVCPGDTVVFTCVTDTGELIWNVNGFNDVLYEKMIEKKEQTSLSIFQLNITNKIGNYFVSTATVINVHLDYNGTSISCSDSSTPHIAETDTKSVITSGILTQYLYVCMCTSLRSHYAYRASISTYQFDLLLHPLLCHHQLGSSTGHTPLCTQLHCHC